jgi:hypothetical protein
MSFDLEQFDDDNQTRLRTIAGVNVSSADDIEDAIMKEGPLPRLCTMYDGGKSDGRLVSGDKGQRVRARLSVVVVAESWARRGKSAASSSVLALVRKVKNTIVTRGTKHGEWQNPQADGPFIYDEDAFMQRNGKRVAHQVEFHCDVYDDFNS